jgi:hypothetical protein
MCGKLGYIAQICQDVLLWECVAAMCGFQKPGHGFFFFPESSSAKQVKKRELQVWLSLF